jgi:hypothetical protein
MKSFSIKCEDAFHARFQGVSFQDDVSIHIWREAWYAALTEVLSLVQNEMPEGEARDK